MAKKAKKSTKAWVMPDWMEPYREHIRNTGGNTVEDLIDRLHHEEGLAFSNIIVYVMAASVESQVQLLMCMREAGCLAD